MTRGERRAWTGTGSLAASLGVHALLALALVGWATRSAGSAARGPTPRVALASTAEIEPAPAPVEPEPRAELAPAPDFDDLVAELRPLPEPAAEPVPEPTPAPGAESAAPGEAEPGWLPRPLAPRAVEPGAEPGPEPAAATPPEPAPERAPAASRPTPAASPADTTVTARGPEPLSAPRPPYPPASVRLGEEGEVLCRLHVAPDGTVSAVEVLESSGHARLDRAARETLARWTFHPAEADDRPVTGELDHRVVFRLVER